MPVMDGMEACQLIRGSVAAAYQPHIIALTAQAMQGDRYIPSSHSLSRHSND
jgi:CheY-like chemotaxis protein